MHSTVLNAENLKGHTLVNPKTAGSLQSPRRCQQAEIVFQAGRTCVE